MRSVHPYIASRNLLAEFLVIYIILLTITLGITEGQGKSEKYTYENKNDRNGAGNAIGIHGNQLIFCEGDLSSCHNVLTNIICSNVKYCIVGDITPFVMSNPL